MKRSSIIEQRRKSVNPETRRAVDFSFLIVDRIHEILERKGLRQKDLAMRLGKKEPEIRGAIFFYVCSVTDIGVRAA